MPKKISSRRSTKKTDGFYKSKQWRRLTKELRTGLCFRCGQVGGRTIIDHIVELRDGGPPLEAGNLQELCMKCHSHKTIQARQNRAGIRTSGGHLEISEKNWGKDRRGSHLRHTQIHQSLLRRQKQPMEQVLSRFSELQKERKK